MRIAIGCDHGALELKEEVKRVLAAYPEIETADMGVYTPESVDYPDIAVKVCAEITGGRAEQGILLCGTGIGISIAANKIPAFGRPFAVMCTRRRWRGSITTPTSWP